MVKAYLQCHLGQFVFGWGQGVQSGRKLTRCQFTTRRSSYLEFKKTENELVIKHFCFCPLCKDQCPHICNINVNVQPLIFSYKYNSVLQVNDNTKICFENTSRCPGCLLVSHVGQALGLQCNPIGSLVVSAQGSVRPFLRWIFVSS